jgi:hypothetical protein
VHPLTPLATTTPTSLALALDMQQKNMWKWPTHTVPHMLAQERSVLDFPLEERQSRTSDLVAWAKTLPLSIKASVMLRPNSIPVMKTSVLLSPTHQRQKQPKHPPTRQHRPPTQLVAALIYSPFASAFSMQEPSSQRFQHPFASSFPDAVAPAKSIGIQTSSTHTPEKIEKGSHSPPLHGKDAAGLLNRILLLLTLVSRTLPSTIFSELSSSTLLDPDLTDP